MKKINLAPMSIKEQVKGLRTVVDIRNIDTSKAYPNTTNTIHFVEPIWEGIRDAIIGFKVVEETSNLEGSISRKDIDSYELCMKDM